MNIRFSHHYQKLNDRLFTTLRPYSPEKEQHYIPAIGKDFNIIVKGHTTGKATLLLVEKVLIESLSNEFLEYDLEGFYKIPKTGSSLFLMFRKCEYAVII